MNAPRHLRSTATKFLSILCFFGLLAGLQAASSAKSVHLAAGSPKVSLPFHDERRATIAVEVAIKNESAELTKVFVEIAVKDAEGNVVTEAEAGLDIAAGGQEATNQWMNFKRPKIWTKEKPYLYTVHTLILRGTDVIDSSKTSFGVGPDAPAIK
ncbi:MAG: hypothetical protein SynsKO_42830 [Synoicihabitans sp.]